MLTAAMIAFFFAPLAAIGAWLYRRDRFRRVLMIGVLVAVGTWFAAIGIALTGWRDIDGFVDCWPDCSAEQNAMKFAFWTGPFAALVLAFASVASLLRR